MQIGVYSFRTADIIWYDCGMFVPVNASSVHDAANNSITFSMADQFAKLDGTRNGQAGGAQTILIPNQDEEGNFIEIKSALINFIKTEGISNYIVDDIGEFYGIQSNNPEGYEDYRQDNPMWNKLPYDLEFDGGSTIADIITEIVTLYPNVQAYFDIYNNFCSGMIPSCTHNPIEIDKEFIQNVLISENSENVDYDIQNIYNVTEVFGKIYDVDRYADSCSTSSNDYAITLPNYEKFSAYEYIAFTPNTTNVSPTKLKINSLSAIPIYNEHTTTFASSGSIIANEMCVVRIMRDKDKNYVAYYLGKYQPHAICVLTDDVNDSVYTKEYFADKYNCKNIILREERNSPFTVQRIGEVLEVKSGSEFENILSDTVAAENAIYYNQISSSENETVTISTKLIPWLDVQCKLSYQKSQEEDNYEYITQSIQNSDTTSTITMKKFYPLYYK